LKIDPLPNPPPIRGRESPQAAGGGEKKFFIVGAVPRAESISLENSVLCHCEPPLAATLAPHAVQVSSLRLKYPEILSLPASGSLRMTFSFFGVVPPGTVRLL